jgi:hypothetical protein
MSIDENFNVIHQAVFGYSNGHRMLASTTQLSSVDEYDLAALSDLAPIPTLNQFGFGPVVACPTAAAMDLFMTSNSRSNLRRSVLARSMSCSLE